MVQCAVVGCKKDSSHDHDVSYYRFPAITNRYGERYEWAEYELRKKRRAGFIAAIQRKHVSDEAINNLRICSRHFISGKPAGMHDVTNPDWLPTLYLGRQEEGNEDKAVLKALENVARYERAKQREKEKQKVQALAQDLQELMRQVPSIVEQLIEEVVIEETNAMGLEEIETGKQYVKTGRHHTETECACCAAKIQVLEEKLHHSELTVLYLTQQLRLCTIPFCEESFKSDDFTRFYTGLPNIGIVKSVFTHCSKGMNRDGNAKLTLFQEFICTLIKLRTNAVMDDLGYRFNVSNATISRIFLKWMKQLDMKLKGLIIWPDREALQKSMPSCFRESFGTKVVVIIDCFELFIERPSNLKARCSTWSSYKHHNTAKVLLGITPQGVISFVSECWGGRVSDVYLTEHCGILKNLLPGDVVLADRGFTIADSVGAMRAKLHIPAFTKGKSQLSALEVEDTRRIANVRIHVERVIGCVRQRFSILHCTIPIHFVAKRKEEEIPLIDRIVRVCCALNNVCDSVVPFD